jgi:hypothetical protein
MDYPRDSGGFLAHCVYRTFEHLYTGTQPDSADIFPGAVFVIPTVCRQITSLCPGGKNWRHWLLLTKLVCAAVCYCERYKKRKNAVA